MSRSQCFLNGWLVERTNAGGSIGHGRRSKIAPIQLPLILRLNIPWFFDNGGDAVAGKNASPHWHLCPGAFLMVVCQKGQTPTALSQSSLILRMKIPWFYDDGGSNAGKNTSPHCHLFPGASSAAVWWKGQTPAVVSTTKQVQNGAISAVPHLENENSFIFWWRRWRCVQEDGSASPAVPRCFFACFLVETTNAGGGIVHKAVPKWRHSNRPSSWEWRFIYFSMTVAVMREETRRCIASCAPVLLWLFFGGIGPEAGPYGPPVHGAFSETGQSAHPCLLGGRPIHAPCLFGAWFIRAPWFLGGWPIGARFLLCGGGRYNDGEDPSMTALLQCAQCKRFKTQQKLHDVLKYNLFWRVWCQRERVVNLKICEPFFFLLCESKVYGTEGIYFWTNHTYAKLCIHVLSSVIKYFI